MKKLKLTNLYLLAGTSVAIGIVPILLSSCSKTDNNIILNSKELYSIDRLCSFGFQTGIVENTNVHVEIINFIDNSLTILNPDFTIATKDNHVDIHVSDKILENKTFSFGLKFTFPNDQSLQEIKINDIKIYYTFQPEDEDGIRADKTNILNTNKYRFDFAFRFQFQPQSDVRVQLMNDYSSKLSLESWGASQETAVSFKTYNAELKEHWYYVDVPIYMQVSLFSQKNIYFALKFTFTNSKGVEQSTTIGNLTASLIFNQDDETPEDFFNIEEGTDGKNHLIGFKNKITMEQIKYFPILRIPDSVQVVDSFNLYNGDAPSLYFDKIIIGPNVTKFSNKALEHCHDISYIDASLFEPSKLFEFATTSVFSDDTFNHSGVIIIPNCESSFDLLNWKGLFREEGFTESKFWKVYEQKLVLPKTYYNVEFDKKLDGNKLISVEGENLSQYAVIDMPKDIVGIDDEAFDILKNNPYIPDVTQTEDFGNRYLCLSPKLKKIDGSENFTEMCLTGLVNIPRKIESLPAQCFENADDIHVSYNSFTKKKFTLNFNHYSQITTLGIDFLHGSSINEIKFPGSLTTVDAGLVRDCYNLSTLDFSEYRSLPEWLTTEGSDTSIYFTAVGTASGISTRTIIVNKEATKIEDWELVWRTWLSGHGLPNKDNWTFIQV